LFGEGIPLGPLGTQAAAILLQRDEKVYEALQMSAAGAVVEVAAA